MQYAYFMCLYSLPFQDPDVKMKTLKILILFLFLWCFPTMPCWGWHFKTFTEGGFP